MADVDIDALLAFHRSHGRCVTLTTVNIAQQKGVLDIDDDNTIIAFREKDSQDSTLINGGFMVCQPGIFDYLKDDRTVLEKEPMRTLAVNGELKSYYHKGFWQCMDTKREMEMLEALWTPGRASWKVWDD